MVLQGAWFLVSAGLLGRLLWLMIGDARLLKGSHRIEADHPVQRLLHELAIKNRLEPGQLCMNWTTAIDSPAVMGLWRQKFFCPKPYTMRTRIRSVRRWLMSCRILPRAILAGAWLGVCVRR